MGRSSLFGLSLSVIAAAALLACGGAQPAPATPAEPGAEPAAASAGEPAPGAWSDSMSTNEKAAFMKNKVMPVMSKLFKEHDATEFASFGCKTCHGATMKPKPVDALPELHMEGGKMLEAEKHPEMAKFMSEKVVPAMAELFGKQPYDPKTNSGFGCGGCHKMSM